MILLTGATGTLGKPLLTRLLDAGFKVRCLVRNPRRLGRERVRVQIAIGNLADHHGFARALRGVDTVIHLGVATRDQGRGTIEQINGIGTARLVNAARRAGARRFVYVSSSGATLNSPSRFIRSQSLARDAVAAADFESLIFEASIIYDPADRWMTMLRSLSRLPAVPVPGDGCARFQPIWADDAADAMMAALPAEGVGAGENVGRVDPSTRSRFVELAGPEVMTADAILRAAMRSAGRHRPLLHFPPRLSHRLLRLQEWYLGPSAPITWDEAVLMAYTSLPVRGTADVEALGVQPRTMSEVLGI